MLGSNNGAYMSGGCNATSSTGAGGGPAAVPATAGHPQHHHMHNHHLSHSNGGGIDASLASMTLEYVLDHNELHKFATQIAHGMRHLHDHQITHR